MLDSLRSWSLRKQRLCWYQGNICNCLLEDNIRLFYWFLAILFFLSSICCFRFFLFYFFLFHSKTREELFVKFLLLMNYCFLKYGVALAKVNDDGSLSYPEIPKENGNALWVIGSTSPMFLSLNFLVLD